MRRGRSNINVSALWRMMGLTSGAGPPQTGLACVHRLGAEPLRALPGPEAIGNQPVFAVAKPRIKEPSEPPRSRCCGSMRADPGMLAVSAWFASGAAGCQLL